MFGLSTVTGSPKSNAFGVLSGTIAATLILPETPVERQISSPPSAILLLPSTIKVVVPPTEGQFAAESVTIIVPLPTIEPNESPC